MSKPTRPRADAARNRVRLVAVARERFAAGDRTVSLGDVARAADVGIATLYRHFPTRESLVEAVYRAELDALAAEAAPLLAALDAHAALRAWMDRYTRFVATKRAMVDALRSAFASGAGVAPETRARIGATLATFLAAGAADGTIRTDVAADDVTVGLAALVLATTVADPDQLRRLLDLLTDGLRPRPDP